MKDVTEIRDVQMKQEMLPAAFLSKLTLEAEESVLAETLAQSTEKKSHKHFKTYCAII